MSVNPILYILTRTLCINACQQGLYTESLRSSSSPRCVPVYANAMWHTSCLEIIIDISVQYRIIILTIYIKICLHMLAENWSFIFSTYICFPLPTDWCSFEGYIICCFKLDIADFCANFVEYKPKTHPTILFCSRESLNQIMCLNSLHTISYYCGVRVYSKWDCSVGADFIDY